MKIEVLFDVAVSPNLQSGDRAATCAYAFATLLPSGEVVCVCRRGATKHSYDGVLAMQRSSDGGRTWSESTVVFDGRTLRPPQSVICGGVGLTAEGTLVAMYGTVEATRPDAFVFSESGLRQKQAVYISRSEDGGRSWRPAAEIDPSPFPVAWAATCPFPLASGDLCVPLEVRTAAGVQATAITFSRDDGRTFEPVVPCAVDDAGRLNLCDARFAVLGDGRILALLWTFRQEGEETIAVHRTYSADDGRTWSPPVPTNISGQIAAPMVLDGDAVIAAVNYRQPPEGIRLWASSDAGQTWDADGVVQMWDARQSRVVAEPVKSGSRPGGEKGVWDALEQFTFGTPGMIRLDDGTVLLTYYATIDGICHIRATRFAVREI